MHTRRTILSALVAGAVLGSGAACAENPLWYAGASLGQSMMDDGFANEWNTLLESQLGVTSSSTMEEEDTAWKIFGGYRLMENLAFEVAYVDFGEFPVDSTITAPASATVRLEPEITAWTLDAVGIFPVVDRLDAFGKVGVAMWDLEADIVASGVGGVAAVSVDNDDSDFHFGVGANFGLTETAAIRLEWERINSDDDLDMWSIGAQVGF